LIITCPFAIPAVESCRWYGRFGQGPTLERRQWWRRRSCPLLSRHFPAM